MKYKNWWKIFFLTPALVNLWWERKPKEKRKNAINNVMEVFTYTGKRWQKIWEQPPVEPKPEPLFELGDFDVMLVNTHGVGCGRTHSSVFESGKHGKLKPGTYKSIVLESPSMDALKYASMQSWPEIKRESSVLSAQKTLNSNDTIDMSLDVKYGDNDIPFGTIHFKWDCE